MIITAHRVALRTLLVVSALAAQLVLIVGCANLGLDRKWRAESLDQQTQIILAQIGLRSEGFDAGPVDGVVGLRTRVAAESFRRAKGLQITDSIDAELIDIIYSDHDFEKAMPYVEGSIRSCFRWGPERVLIMASNLGTITCTVGNDGATDQSRIEQARKFCIEAVPLGADVVKCDMIYDGRRILNHRKLIQALNLQTSSLPILLQTHDLPSNMKSEAAADLQVQPPLYKFHDSKNILREAAILQLQLPARITGRQGRTICEGTVTPVTPRIMSYNMICFGKAQMRGEARMIGVFRSGESLLPAYETSAQNAGFQMRIIPPENTILFK